MSSLSLLIGLAAVVILVGVEGMAKDVFLVGWMVMTRTYCRELGIVGGGINAMAVLALAPAHPYLSHQLAGLPLLKCV